MRTKHARPPGILGRVEPQAAGPELHAALVELARLLARQAAAEHIEALRERRGRD